MPFLIYIEDLSREREALQLAERLNCEKTYDNPCMDGKTNADQNTMLIRFGHNGVSLEEDGMVLINDFTKIASRIKRDRIGSEQIVKAARIKGVPNDTLSILDATAGFGEDSVILAAAGYRVDLYEYNPIIATLLADAVARIGKSEEFSEIAGRMTVHEGDSIAAMNSGEAKADIIFLDPMFPKRQKSGLIKKKFQLLQKLECPCAEESELLNAAINAKPRRIIIKRPLKGPYLAGRKPDYSIEGKTIRYDCIVIC